MLTGQEGKKFSSTYQPTNRRKSVKFLTELLTKELKGKKRTIEIEGIDVTTGKKTRIRVDMPTKQNIVQALLRQAARGNMVAIKEVFDRMEGKPEQPIDFLGNLNLTKEEVVFE